MTIEKTEPSAKDKKDKKFHGVVTIDRESCKGCGFCIEFCPSHVLCSDKSYNAKGYHPPIAANPDACTGCDLCGLYCPDFAIFGSREKPEERSGRFE